MAWVTSTNKPNHAPLIEFDKERVRQELILVIDAEMKDWTILVPYHDICDLAFSKSFEYTLKKGFNLETSMPNMRETIEPRQIVVAVTICPKNQRIPLLKEDAILKWSNYHYHVNDAVEFASILYKTGK